MDYKEKYTLSIIEAAEYFGIGQKRLRKLAQDNPDAEFFLWIGSRVRIKRDIFQKYIDKLNVM